MTVQDPIAPIRVIQVGAGGMGRVWLQLLLDTPEVELVGLVDLDTDAAGRALREAGRPDIPVAVSLSEIARSSHAQAVINVTVPAAHHPVNIEAMFAGLAVLCEKPIAPTVRQALSLAAASEASSQLLMTSQSRRYFKTLSEFKDSLGSLGEVGIVTTEFFMAPRFGGFRDSMAHPLLVDMSIHAFDVARYLLDAEPVSVYCDSYNPPWSWYAGDAAATATFEFDGGVRYSFNGSWCSPGVETSWNGWWRASGSQGSATWDGETVPTIDLGDGPIEKAGSGRDLVQETIAGSLAEFVHSLRTGRVPAGEVHSNVLSLAMVEAAVESAVSGQRVAISSLLENSYGEAVAAETRPEVLALLSKWGSAETGLKRVTHDAV